MNERYQKLYKEVSSFVNQKRFDLAKSLLDGMDGVKDQLLSRAIYLVYGNASSQYFSPAIAKEQLDFLEKNSDSWGLAEKGRCLLFGEFWEKDTHAAEDILRRASKKEPKAMYYIAYTHANGIHKHEDEPVYDFDEAIKLFKEISRGKNRYSNKACLEYCKLMMREEHTLSTEERAEVFGLLLKLVDSGNDDAGLVMSRFLLGEALVSVDVRFSQSKTPSSMAERIQFESGHRNCLLAVDTLKKELLT